MTPTVCLVDPTGGAMAAPAFVLAPRFADLRGKSLGLLDNSKSGSESILRTIAALLDDEFKWTEIVYVRKHSASLPPTPEVMETLRHRADVVITGVGDWGGCSSGSVLDGVTLEQQGIPTATIITDVFVRTAEAYTKMLGVPDFPYLVCPHPITSVGAKELEARARLLAPGVRRLLLGGQ